MIQTISDTDKGSIFRVPADSDLSAFTDLVLTFTGPVGQKVVKSFLVGGLVKLGTANVFDKNLKQDLLANEYVEYIIEDPFPFSIGKPWKALLTFVIDSQSPPLRTSGKTAPIFEVCEGG